MILVAFLGLLLPFHSKSLESGITVPIWTPPGIADDADAHVAFRGRFTTQSGGCSISLVGASEYLVWLDGKLVEDGPARFSKPFPEYQRKSFNVGSGGHIIALQVHNDGVATRMLPAVAPFLWCDIEEGGNPVSINWKCARIPGYIPRVRRISDNLGWIDWFDTSQSWPDWQQPSFNDSKWLDAVKTDPGIGAITEAATAPVRLNELTIRPAAEGRLTQNFGYESDDPAVRFFLADLDPRNVPAQGVWRRYDLGRVRLGRPDFTLDLQKGTVVEFALCEQLRHGRVHPWITLSGSTSCNMDHFMARGGPQEFMPFSPKGGRFLEVHVMSPGPVKFIKEEFLERGYYGEPIGSFQCNDPLLNQIWSTGVVTTRVCADDALIDCPSRERGEWTGDTSTVATDNCSVAYSDLSLSRRVLVQAAQSARADGLVAGLEPGEPQYISTFATLWVSACVHYWELTGDKALLSELLPAAQRNIAALQSKMTPDGLQGDVGWEFVDWGYVPNSGPSDMALNIDYFMALQAMARWHEALNEPEKSKQDSALATPLAALVKKWLRGQIQKSGGWVNVGYHRAALGLLAGLVEPADEPACIAGIEAHLLTCFPNDSNGPRLTDPSVANDRLMTPYFCQFAFTALLEHGETNFVLNEYRKCWGWALAQGWKTWPEVFDPRWSLCHGWSGCPTWQLTRYVLGFRPRFDLGDNVYEVDIHPGDLHTASGDVPLKTGKSFRVEWHLGKGEIDLKIATPEPIVVRIGNHQIRVTGHYETTLPQER